MSRPRAFYNEIDPYAVEYLKRLMAKGLIMDGVVSDRSIADLHASELVGFTRVHLFAGIGLWDLALQFANWPRDVPVWTGSCPCQPFSVAGKQKGTDDPRHLWPEMLRLMANRFPAVVFGEQVAGPDGRQWLSGVRTDLEGLGYAVGATDLCAAGVTAPHQRQRLYWGAARLGDADIPRLEGRGVLERGRADERSAWTRSPPVLSHRSVPDADSERLPKWEECDGGAFSGPNRQTQLGHHPLRSGFHGSWGSEWALCADQKTRRVEPSIRLVADVRTLRARVGRLRATGNAIVPEVAQVFVEEFTNACQSC